MDRFLEVRRILVPVDFSESARSVLEYALDVARDRGAEIELFHVVGVPLPPFDPVYGLASDPALLVDLETAATRSLAAMEATAREAGVPAKSVVVTGTPSREIVREARKWSADLVVIGTHGRTGLRHVFLGSVAENVVRLAPCAVLTVRVKGFEIEKV